MINYLLRETKSQERLRLDKLIADKDYANYIRLFDYYDNRNEYIKALAHMSDYVVKATNIMNAVFRLYIKGVK